MPVIETAAVRGRAADHACSTANVSVPRAASLPSTLASARPLPIGPRMRSRSHVSSSSSPGSTIRLKRTPSMPAKSASRPRFSSCAQHRDRARLRHRLDDQDAGHDRPPGKVACQIPLVRANGLPRDDALAGLELDHLVDQEERVAVREDLFDLRFVERGLGRHGRPSVVGDGLSLRPDSVVPRLRGRFGHPYLYAEVCPSTQRLLTDEHSEGAVALTEEQTEGRGRLGRSWHSPPGMSLLFSTLLEPPVETARLPELTVVAGEAVRRGDRTSHRPRSGDQAPERHPDRRPQDRGHPRRGARRPSRPRHRRQREPARGRPPGAPRRRRSSSRRA